MRSTVLPFVRPNPGEEEIPEAHFVSERIVSLPLFPGLSEADQDDAIESVRELLEEFRR